MRIIGLALVCVVAAAGCVANEPAAPTRGTVVSGPPPAPVAEAHPSTPPSPDSVWVAGYWHWTGAQYTWVPGHWENAPHGSRWSAPAYTSRDGAYFYEAGHWDHGAAPAPGVTAAAPGPNATAKALH